MPIYEYQAIEKGCPHCEEIFEVLERVKDKPLKKCPECGEKVQRILSAFGFGGNEKDLLSPKNLEKNGFTQYKKTGDGNYEKTLGKGPSMIRRDNK